MPPSACATLPPAPLSRPLMLVAVSAVISLGPAGPCSPCMPGSPFAPVSPCGPLMLTLAGLSSPPLLLHEIIPSAETAGVKYGPVSPFAPSAPLGPWIPCGPCSPVSPFAPGSPCAPFSPVAPFSPCGMPNSKSNTFAVLTCQGESHAVSFALDSWVKKQRFTSKTHKCLFIEDYLKSRLFTVICL